MKRLALCVGDPNGIGPEIVLKALWERRDALREPGRIAVFGPRKQIEAQCSVSGLTELLEALDIRDVGPVPESERVPGLVCASGGASAIASATAAITAVRNGEFDAVIAGPHHETAVREAGISFSGYPSLVERVCGLPRDSVFVMLVGAGLRIVHTTLHEQQSAALARLTAEMVVRAAEAGGRACQALGVQAPRIGLFGINPHASEGDLFGDDDRRVTFPAAARLRELGWDASDPRGGDVLLADRHHDLYVAMVHDQGHIPVKLLAPQAATALSVGAGVMLATVAHGSAMDIAGRNQARPDALLRTWALIEGAAA